MLSSPTKAAPAPDTTYVHLLWTRVLRSEETHAISASGSQGSQQSRQTLATYLAKTSSPLHGTAGTPRTWPYLLSRTSPADKPHSACHRRRSAGRRNLLTGQQGVQRKSVHRFHMPGCSGDRKTDAQGLESYPISATFPILMVRSVDLLSPR